MDIKFSDRKEGHVVEIVFDLDREFTDPQEADCFLTLEMENPDAQEYYFEMDIHEDVTEEDALKSANFLRKALAASRK